MIELSVIIPAYNEEQRILPTIIQFYKLLKETAMPFEIIVVDDGSADKTVEVVRALQNTYREIIVLALRVNKGKGHAVRHGMLAAKGRFCMFADADGSTPATEIEKLIEPLVAGNADVSIGSRYHQASQVSKAQPKLRVLWSRMVNGIVQRTLLPGIVDTHCGFKAFTKEALQVVFPLCEVDGWSFDLEVLALARKHALRVCEVPVAWANDERSKARLRQMPRELYSFYKIRKRIR